MLEGIDCASPINAGTAKALKSAGKHFACRYLSTPGNPKNLEAKEAAVLTTAGLATVTVFETTGSRALDGANAGHADALAASAQAAALGGHDVPIYFAVDFDAQPAQLPAVVAYIKGAADAIGAARVGVYGGLHVIKACADAKACHFLWQTYAWSGTPTVWDKRAQLHQYENGKTVAGLSVDLDRALTADYGQWAPPKPRPRWSVVVDGKTVAHTNHPKLWEAAHPRRYRKHSSIWMHRPKP
jgi:hypothetical protein